LFVEAGITGIDFEYLPPYAPELNPVEWVWDYGKEQKLINFAPQHQA
jgi:transposase